jgi:hypothetical protein
VSLVTGRSKSPNPVVAEAGGLAPERAGERVAAVEATDRSGAAPESASSKRASPKQGSKHAAPEQGPKHAAPEKGSSGRPAKKPRVRSKM